ncbi:hypothetical protein GCM10022217_24270 [Chryseobacterium ginsenosidimutans]|uniref:beta strand repeat-containing protein n=1 Tax=Chryseobacterium ginsenosidimutans TaxID=687846 RepID=UPI0031D50485
MRKILTFLIAVSSPLILFGQSPGGVVPAAWYKADASSTLFSDAGVTNSANNSTVYQWNDAQGNGFNLLQATAGLRPTFSNTTTLANFNPTVTFQSKWMEFQPGTGINIIDRVNGTLFTAGYINTLTGCGIFGFDSTMDYPGLHTSNNGLNNLLFFTGGPGYQGLTSNSFQNNFYFTAGSSWQNGAGTNASYAAATVSLNGNRTDYSGSQLQNAVQDVNARDIRVGGDTNWGSLNGQVNEMLIFENRLTADEMDRVESYLSVKYGTTYAQGTKDYKNSSSTVVWSSSANSAYNNNIAGIARDATGLNQKQSWSVNSGKQILIGTTGLANTNAANSTSLTAGQYLIWGDNGLQKTPAVAISGISGINYRFASIWKAQNTGNVGTVRVTWPTGLTNLRLIQSNDAVFDNTDTVTDMSVNTQTVNGVIYNYADVTLADGQYFTLAAYVHAPGGVLSSLWYRADKGLVPATGAVTTWTDYSAGQIPVTPALSSSTSAPTSVNGTGLNFNFNPAVTFLAANALGNSSVLNAVSSTNYSIYTSITSVTGSGYDRVVGLNYSALTGGNKYDSPGIAAVNINMRDNAAGSHINAAVTPVAAQYTQLNNTTIVRNSFTNNQFQRALNGAAILSNMAMTALTTWPDGGIILGRNANDGGDDNGTGMTMSETIVFDGALSANDVNRVDSYLAIKGGITLDITNTPNYLSSTSANVWNSSTNTGYNNNIFGIANDFVSDLNQKQSKSINNSQKLIIGAGGALANTNALNTNTLTDGQFLLVGDNGLKQGLSVPINGITGINYRFASIWKAQNTGNVGTVRIAWPAGLAALRLIQSPDAVFDNTDTVTDMSVNTQTVNGVTYNYADVTLANGQFFTFAAFAHAPGGIINGLSQWYRADIDATNTGNATDVTSWKDYFSGTVSAQIAGKALPKYKIGDATYFNYNPGVSFTAITQTLGNITTQTITNTSNDVFTLTKEGMTFPGSPNPHFFSITADNATTDASSWDYLGFFPNATIERRVVGGGTQLPSSGVTYSTTIPSIMYNTFTNTSLARGLNGAANGSTVTTSAMGLALGGHVFGDTRWTGNSSDNGGIVGDMGETIIYGDGNLTAAERRKVDTYLAIKYGITLGRVATDNYVSSADAAIWNGALNNTYNNNVFGLAKDDISSLHQKVSKSVNTGTILTMATGNDFVSQNIAASRTSLSGDQKYFLAGDNTVTATPLVGFTVSGNPAQRIQRIWLSQRTNTLGNIYFAADLSAYGTGLASGNNVRMFVADDAAFTVNVQSVAGSYSGGKWIFSKSFDSDATARYITFGSELQPQVLWVRADKGVNTASGVPADNTQITTWYDQETANGSQDGTTPTVDPGEPAETAGTLPTLPFYKYNATDNFNFNPVINFSNLNRGNAVQFTTPTFGSQTVISVFKAAGFGNSQATSMLLYGGDVSNPSAGDAAPARADMSFGVSAGSFLSFGGGSAGDYNYIGNLGLQTQPAIGVLKRNRVGDEEIYYSSYGSGSNDILNQNADPSNTLTGEGRLLSGLVRIGKHFSAPTTLNDPTGRLNGAYAELIVYDRVLTEAERAMVESYLAVKYGITLTGGTDQFGATAGNVSYPYVNSSGAVVRASDATYKYDVFGLGRDDYYGLNQRISKSNDAGDILTVSTNTDFTSLNLDATRTAIDGDQEFMLFANNKGSGSAVVEQITELPANVGRRLDREWKVAQTNTDGTDISNVSLKFNLTGITLTGATAANVMLLVDTDGDGDFTTGTVQVIPASSYTAGSAVSFNSVVLANGQVFTLGIAQGLCYKPGAVASAGNPALNSKVGITSLNRAGTAGDNWPGIRTGGWLVLESKTKGFVPNRVAFSGANPVGIAPANFVEGMLVYDTTNKCMKIYTSQDNGVTFGWYCLTTQTCPD